jgi:hypothetical protein
MEGTLLKNNVKRIVSRRRTARAGRRASYFKGLSSKSSVGGSMPYQTKWHRLINEIDHSDALKNNTFRWREKGPRMGRSPPSYGLADFLTGVCPDRMEARSEGQNAEIKLIFSG